MASVAALRTVKVSYVSEGAEKFRSDAEAAAASQTNLAQQSERAALVSEQAARRQLSATTAFEKLRATVDPTVRALQQYERGLSTLDRALAQDASLAADAADVQRLLQRRYDDAAAAANRLSIEQRALARDTIAAREAAMAQASAFQATLNQRVGVRAPSVGSDRASDFAAAADAADRLRARYDPLFAAQRAYRTDLTELRGALSASILTEDAYSAALGRRKAAFAETVAGLGRVSVAQREATAATEALAAANDRAARGWSSLGSTGRETLQGLDVARRMAGASAVPSAANQNAAGRRLRQDEVTNLMYQGGDIAAQLGSGSPLGMIAMQQGPQIAQIFAGPGGASVKGALGQAGEAASGFLSKIGPVGLGLGGLTLAAGVGAAALLSYRSAQTELERSIGGVGRASGVTVDSINRMADAQARAAGMSRGTARETAAIYAGTGRVGPELLGSAVGVTRDVSKFLGVDQTEGATVLAGALGDVSRGATDLSQRYGLLNDATAESIRRMDAQGDRLGAQKRLLDAVRESTQGLAEQTTGWGRVSQGVSDIWGELGRVVDKAVTGGDLDTRLKTARDALAEARRDAEGSNIFYRQAVADPRIATFEADVRRLEKLAETRDGLIGRLQSAQRSAEIGNLVRLLQPDLVELRTMQDRVELLRKAISDPIKFGLDQRQVMDATTAFERLSRITKAMADDIERFGSVSAAQMVRTAEFNSRLTGLTPLARQTAERQQAYATEARERGFDPSGASSTLRLSMTTDLFERNRLLQQDREQAARAQARDTDIATYRRQAQLDLNRTGGAFSRFDPTLQSQILNAARGSVSAEIIAAIAGKESSGNANVGYSKILGEDGRPSSAYGLGQITRGTAQEAVRLGYLPQGFDRTDVATMAQGIAGVLQMKIDQNGGDRDRGIMAYRGSNDPSVNRSYLAEVLRKSGQMGDVSEAGLARDQDANARALKSANDNLRLNTELYGVNGARLEAQTRATEQYNALLARGVTAADAASIAFSGLNDKLVSVERAGRLVQFTRDDQFSRDQLGRDRIDQQAYALARSRFGDTTSPEAQAAIGRARDTLEMSETKSLFTDGVTSFVTDLRRGGDAATALSNAFGNAADRLIAKVMDSAISSAFGAIGGGSGSGGIGGFFSSLFGGGASAGASPTGGVRLFDVGGYTGAGGRLEPAGIVHRGEVVWSQGDVARVGGVAVAEAIRRGLPGYSAGGSVGAPAWMPPPANSGAMGAAPAFNFYDQRPAGSPDIEPTARRRPDGGFDVIVRSVEGRMGQRAAGGQGPFRQAAGGAGYRNG